MKLLFNEDPCDKKNFLSSCMQLKIRLSFVAVFFPRTSCLVSKQCESLWTSGRCDFVIGESSAFEKVSMYLRDCVTCLRVEFTLVTNGEKLHCTFNATLFLFLSTFFLLR